MKSKILNVPHWAKWLLTQVYVTPTKVESGRIVKMTKSLFPIEMTLYSKYLFSAGKRLFLNCSPNREVLQGRGTPDVSQGLFEKLLSVLLVNCLLKCSFKNFLKYFLQKKSFGWKYRQTTKLICTGLGGSSVDEISSNSSDLKSGDFGVAEVGLASAQNNGILESESLGWRDAIGGQDSGVTC